MNEDCELVEPRAPEKKKKRIVTYCKVREHEALKRRARELNVSMSDYVMGVLRRLLKFE